MYIPVWLLIIGIIFACWVYRSRNKQNNISNDWTFENNGSVEQIETTIRSRKKSLFELEQFDSPHFIDIQNSFNAMEVNYLRLKHRFIHTPEKDLEIARDWYRYVIALRHLKSSRVVLDIDPSEDPYGEFDERNKEPFIIKEEIEKNLNCY